MKKDKTLADAVNRQIRSLTREHCWTNYRLAKEASVPVSSINNLYSRGSCPTLPLLERLCDAFGITIADFFDGMESGNLPSAYGLTEEEDAFLQRYRSLSKTNQKIASAYLEGMINKKKK